MTGEGGWVGRRWVCSLGTMFMIGIAIAVVPNARRLDSAVSSV